MFLFSYFSSFVFKKVSENKNKTKFFDKFIFIISNFQLLSLRIPKSVKVKNFQQITYFSWKWKFSILNLDLKVEKVKNFQRNYLESEKFFSKFSYFLERENFQNLNLKVRIFKKKISTKSKSKLLKVKNIPRWIIIIVGVKF